MKQVKPIFIINVPVYLTKEDYDKFEDSIQSNLGKDYHVIMIQDSAMEFKFELFNPSLTLQDIDIESLKEKLSLK